MLKRLLRKITARDRIDFWKRVAEVHQEECCRLNETLGHFLEESRELHTRCDDLANFSREVVKARDDLEEKHSNQRTMLQDKDRELDRLRMLNMELRDDANVLRSKCQAAQKQRNDLVVAMHETQEYLRNKLEENNA